MGLVKTSRFLDRFQNVGYTSLCQISTTQIGRTVFDKARLVMRTTALAVGTLLLVIVTGCAGNRQEQASADLGDGDYRAPASIYTVMDSTSLVYTNAVAGSPINDNVWRWTGFILHPVGVVLDYGFNRPVYKLTSSMPYLFGYTSEDAMLDKQRP
jgi:hypothetical protein